MILQSTSDYVDADLKSAMNAAISNNDELIIPPRTNPYLISSTVKYNLVNGKELKLVIKGGSVLKSASGLRHPMLNITGEGSLCLSGTGKLDCSSGTHIVGKQSSTALSARFLKSLIVTGGLHFYGGRNYKENKGDSGITAGSCDRVLISDNCLFEGWADAGVYITGDNSLVVRGSGAVVTGCHFLRNKNDITSKRLYYATTVSHSFFKESYLGVTTLNASEYVPSGKSLKVVNSHFENLVRPITIRMSDHAVINGNIINGWGIEYDGTDLTRRERAVIIDGSKGTHMRDNTFICGTQKCYAIEQKDYEFLGENYFCGHAYLDNTFYVNRETKPYADIHASLPSVVKSAELNSARSEYVNRLTRREITHIAKGSTEIYIGSTIG